MIAGKLFNGFAPEHNPYPSYGFPVETWIGLIMSIYVGVVNLGVAFVEELAFRHEMMYRFGSNKSLMILSVVISSLLFGFSHYYNFSGSLIASLSYAVAGVVLSIAYIVSKNIWVPIITHMLFNGIAVVSTVILIVFKIIGTI
ncbi:CPBP family intramembrane glutamic endopeptidase [Apilactobacillus ozensis]|uniref:CPBP family intramembrane glutamic endopeptidase n=1 Tax=Apilactobacillus ozensis TaxID=866801 RepID=UPI00200B8DA6|nr:CPBP family intramembrane glutamic endopeptidase [Apilactobacillus ozensis]MCK8607171.1 CPBP family intramembrane metalloprotease [Apilactobacillus ozensis]